jgi:hypothetical protein
MSGVTGVAIAMGSLGFAVGGILALRKMYVDAVAATVADVAARRSVRRPCTVKLVPETEGVVVCQPDGSFLVAAMV